MVVSLSPRKDFAPFHAHATRNGTWHANGMAGEIPALETDQNALNKLDFEAQANYWRDLLRHHLLKHAIGTTGMKNFGLKGRCSLRMAQQAFRDLGEFQRMPGTRNIVNCIKITSLEEFVNFARFQVRPLHAVTTALGLYMALDACVSISVGRYQLNECFCAAFTVEDGRERIRMCAAVQIGPMVLLARTRTPSGHHHPHREGRCPWRYPALRVHAWVPGCAGKPPPSPNCHVHLTVTSLFD